MFIVTEYAALISLNKIKVYLKTLKMQLIKIIFFPIHSNIIPFVYLKASLTYKNVLSKLELDYTHLLKIMVKNAKFIKKILNLLSSLNSTQFHIK